MNEPDSVIQSASHKLMPDQHTQTVRTRYAPSPTGKQHIGGLRTALYNYLVAYSLGGQFVIRIEDTDRSRAVAGAEHDIINSIEWLGIRDYEGGLKDGPYKPYIQSHRQARYADYAQQLVKSDRAYVAYDHPDDLVELRERGHGYDGRARLHTKQRIEQLKEQGVERVIRFKSPHDGITAWNDAIVGAVSFENSKLPIDPILLKSDKFPTYHLASVVDDHEMHISHVVRAQEWISSTPLHLQLYQSFGWRPPSFVHLPPIIGADNKKLSKRDGALSVEQIRRTGIVPAALFNCLLMLGWAFDDKREFFTLDQARRLFSVDNLQRSPAQFNMEKLYWYNKHYLQQLNVTDYTTWLLEFHGDALLAALQNCTAFINTRGSFEEWIVSSGGNGAEHTTISNSDSNGNGNDTVGKLRCNPRVDALFDRFPLDFIQWTVAILGTVCAQLQQRISVAAESTDWLSYLWDWDADSLESKQLVGKKLTAAEALGLLEHLRYYLQNKVPMSYFAAAPSILAWVEHYAEQHNLHPGFSKGVVRYALSANKRSLPVDTLIASLPLAEVMRRVEGAIAVLSDE